MIYDKCVYKNNAVDLWGNPIEVGDNEDHFLMFKMSECDACHRMHSAFIKIKPPARVAVFVLDSQDAVADAAIEYKLEELPTLIYYRNGIEVVRWGGFFGGDIEDSSKKLEVLLKKAFLSPVEAGG